MLIVHHLNNSRSQRVLWLLEELGADYEIKRYERNKKTMLAPPELREVHPLGKSPVITDGDRAIAESGAIIEYIVDRFDDDHKMRPALDSREFDRYRYWLHYAEGSAMGPLLLQIVFSELPKQGPWIARPLLNTVSKMVTAEYIRPQIKLHVEYWEKELAESPYFTGDTFSAADIQMSFPVEGVASRGGLDKYPNLASFLEKIQQRPAYRKAIERGGEYSLDL